MRNILDKAVSRRGALTAFVGAGGLMSVAALGACSKETAPASADVAQTSEGITLEEEVEKMKWWQKTVVFEAYPKSFLDTVGQGTGTLAGITQKLDYLKKLGVGAIWLTPVFKSPQKDNGYDVADYYDIDPSYGTMADMDELMKEAKDRDIRIVMDMVMNHTSNENEWFKQSEADPEGPYGDWYIWRDAKEDGSAPTNWRGIFGGSAWTWSEKRKQYYLHTFADFQPDLNWANEDLRKELFKMAKFWLDKGAGGFRLDAIPYIKKPAFVDAEPDGEPAGNPDGMAGIHAVTVNTDGILDYLQAFKKEVMEGSDAFTVGEANGVKPEELPDWVGENGVFDMVFEFAHVLVPSGGSEIWYKDATWKLTDLKKAFAASQQATATNGWYPVYLENHDQPRSPNNFCPEASDTVAAAKMLGTILMTMRGTPFLFQGEELGFTNAAMASIDDYDDANAKNQYDMAIAAGKTPQEALAAVQKHSRDNARTPMQWDTTENAGFTTGKPWLPVHSDFETCNAQVEEADADSVLSYYHTLADLRAKTPLLYAGDYKEILSDSEEIFAFERGYDDKRLVVLANFVEKDVTYDPKLVEGLSVLSSTVESSEAGKLKPLEAVIYA